MHYGVVFFQPFPKQELHLSFSAARYGRLLVGELVRLTVITLK